MPSSPFLCARQPASDKKLGATPPSVSFAWPSSATGAAADRETALSTQPMPHQRHGHTCFAWDPRNVPALANGGEVTGTGVGAGGRKY